MSTEYREQRLLWSEIFKMVSQGLPSLIAGDFDYIMRSHEKMGGRQFANITESRELREFVGDAGWIDLGYLRPRFTWCNNRVGTTKV